MVEINVRRPRKGPSPDQVRAVLAVVEKQFPAFHRDGDQRTMALISLAQCVGAVASWTLNQRGEESCRKALQMVYAMGFDLAVKGDALMRDVDAKRRTEAEREKKQ